MNGIKEETYYETQNFRVNYWIGNYNLARSPINMELKKKFWISFGILIIGLVSLIFFLTTPETPTVEKIGFTGLIMSYIGLLLSLFFSSGFKRSFVLGLFGVNFSFAHTFYYGPFGPEMLFYWIPGWICLSLGCIHAIWTYSKSRRDAN